MRPVLHFTPPYGWMNDPNGLVWFEGEYHLFYQYYPDALVWGPMHWGHAVSRDLLHWEHLPVALAPDTDGYVFSGSVVFDRDNTSGLGEPGRPPLVAIYTTHDPDPARKDAGTQQAQAIAFSLDRGRSWQRHAGNPVLPNPGATPDFRDPSVSWHEPSRQWVMALAVGDHIALYGSANLLQWQLLSRFGQGLGSHAGVWECPNLFPLPVTGGTGSRWVLLVSLVEGGPQGGSATQYFVGDFDGRVFTLDAGFLSQLQVAGAVWLDHGPDNYAGITYNDAPDGRRLFVGWMSNWRYAAKVPATTWRSAMTLPRELDLRQELRNGHWQLASQPLRELVQLRGAPLPLPVEREAIDLPSTLAGRGELELQLYWPAGATGSVVLELRNHQGEQLRIGVDHELGWFVDRRMARHDTAWHPEFAALLRLPVPPGSTTVRCRWVIDRTSVELFIADGERVLTSTFFPSEVFDRARLLQSGAYRLVSGAAYVLGAT